MPHEQITGDLTIDQMKQIAYDAMIHSKGSVSISIEVWAHNHTCDEEPTSSVRIFYCVNNGQKKFKNLRELAKHVYVNVVQ